MLLQARMAAAARLAAALVAVMLSGVPHVLALQAPVEGHRCSCRAHAGEHHDCECARCHRASLAVRAADESAPPCHRDAARKELADREPARSRGAACLEGTCGRTDRQPVALAGIALFCAPAGEGLRVVQRVEHRSDAVAPVPERSPEPETPPPRAA